MEKDAVLKEKAAMIRRLAQDAGSDLTIELLLALATETDAKAAEAERERKTAIATPPDHPKR